MLKEVLEYLYPVPRMSEDSVNTHLINELDIPVTVLGGKDLVVAASPDGILVSDKASSPKVKGLIKDFDQPPMYEERIWGWSRTLDYTKYDDEQEMVTQTDLYRRRKEFQLPLP
ncbi:mannose-1-phosphate guanylyltransferase [Salinibacillus kushneri]|uniref:Mannose-1-phosphate guanylyltransferase n=1 Tax=Salinibacillus kushneri TaxID=237682 RepID=A0A1H9ZEG8_9BACI|nr:mannose-1-phosphate guanylyltransferase [Salinibacillus kushneri]